MDSSITMKPERKQKYDQFISRHSDCVRFLRNEMYGDPTDYRIVFSLLTSMSRRGIDSPEKTVMYCVAAWLSENDIPLDMPRRQVVKAICKSIGFTESSIVSTITSTGFKKTMHLLTQKDWKKFKCKNLSLTGAPEMNPSITIKPERKQRYEDFTAKHRDCVQLLKNELYGEPSDLRVASSLRRSMLSGKLNHPKDTLLYRIALWLSQNDIPAGLLRHEFAKVLSEALDCRKSTILSSIRAQGFKKTMHFLTDKDLKAFKARELR